MSSMVSITRRAALLQMGMAVTALGSRAIFASDESALEALPRRSEFKKFAASIAGRVIAFGDADYDSARLLFNRAFDRHPAMVVRCASADDVARSMEFARRQHLPLSVRGGGHNRAGLSIRDGSVVVDMSQMNAVEVDTGNRVASAQAGAMAVQLDAATQQFGLATTSAGCPTVGIAGLTLGGGEGFLMSKYGAACDNLLSANLVLADGRQVVASEHSNPDLYWAIRGGGGNFGVATRLEYRLYPLSDVLAGTLAYPAGRLAELLHGFGQFVASAPDEMNVIAQILPSADGARFLITLCHCGDPRSGNSLIEPLRAMKPAEERIRVASYMQVNATINPAAPVAHFQTNVFVPALNDAVIGVLSEATGNAPEGTRLFMVPFYGAVARVPAQATAFPLRTTGFELDITTRWSGESARKDGERWVLALRDKLRPLAVGAYVNQLGETSGALVRYAYGERYARLAQLKRKFDPDNTLRSNQNIEPA